MNSGLFLANISVEPRIGSDALESRLGDFLQAWWSGLRPGRVALRIVALALCIAFWQVASSQHLDFGIVTFKYVPAPSDTVVAAWSLLHSPKLASHISNSLIRVFSGFGIALLLGLMLFATWNDLQQMSLFKLLGLST